VRWKIPFVVIVFLMLGTLRGRAEDTVELLAIGMACASVANGQVP